MDSKPLDMTPLPTSDLETLTPARHELYDEQRISYHSELVIVQTSTARSIIHQGTGTFPIWCSFYHPI